MEYQGFNDYYGSSFVRCFRCYSVNSINKPHLENGDKIIMPASALAQLVYMRIEYPMLFEITNPCNGYTSHCGVMEFVADEGTILLPSWMMENMLINEGDIVRMKTASLRKATYVKLQPHTMDFLDISNPKAVLEKTLRQFSCLTSGDTIIVHYNNKKFKINVVETKPSSAVSIIETDCEVDFAPPLDYKEPEKPPRPVERPPCEEEAAKEVPLKCVAFTGVGRRLNGKPSTVSNAPPVSSPQPKEQQPPSSSSASRRRPGKLVFGSTSGQASKKAKVAEEVKCEAKSQEDGKPKFEAFTGRKYTLNN